MCLRDNVSTKVLLTFWGRMRGILDPDACWIWGGATQEGKNGMPYGYVRWRLATGEKRKKLRSHRVAFVLYQGIDYADIAGKDIHHKCGETLCSNPLHLKSMTISAHARISRLKQWEEDQEWLDQDLNQQQTRQLSGYPNQPQPDCVE